MDSLSFAFNGKKLEMTQEPKACVPGGRQMPREVCLAPAGYREDRRPLFCPPALLDFSSLLLGPMPEERQIKVR